jgi:hypothetical protein
MLRLKNDPLSPLWRRDGRPLLAEDAPFATLNGSPFSLRLLLLMGSCRNASPRDFIENGPRAL